MFYNFFIIFIHIFQSHKPCTRNCIIYYFIQQNEIAKTLLGLIEKCFALKLRDNNNFFKQHIKLFDCLK